MSSAEVGIEEVVGEATSFFSYCWVGTVLRDMLDAIEKILAALEADGKRRYVWIDIFCASQNLLQGVIKDPAMSSAEVGIEDAISTVGELLFYMEPLAGEWAAPPHPFLLAGQGDPQEGWVLPGLRHTSSRSRATTTWEPPRCTVSAAGPDRANPFSRAWCIFELAKALAKGCTLHMLLSPESVRLFERKLRRDPGGFHWAGKLLDGIDVKRAQLSKVEDRRALAALSPTPP